MCGFIIPRIRFVSNAFFNSSMLPRNWNLSRLTNAEENFSGYVFENFDNIQQRDSSLFNIYLKMYQILYYNKKALCVITKINLLTKYHHLRTLFLRNDIGLFLYEINSFILQITWKRNNRDQLCCMG